MGRHATQSADRTPRRPPTVVLVAAVAVVVLLAGGLVWWLSGSDGSNDSDTAGTSCTDPQSVRVTVVPELVDAVGTVLSDDALAGDCVTAEVTGQSPAPVVGALSAGAGTAVPDVWVPDSSVWPAQVGGDAALETVGSVASSPIVLATSRAAAETFDWIGEAPGWLEVVTQAIQGGLTFPVADVTGNTRQLGVSLAVQAALPPGSLTDEQLATTFAVTQGGTTVDEVREAATRGDEEAGLFASSEQEVIASHQAGDSQLVAVYPGTGSPRLDYPLVRVGSPDGAHRAAVDTVVEALTSDAEAAAVRAAGFRDADGAAPDDAGDPTGTRADEPADLAFTPDQAIAAIELSERVLAPSRLLVVIDTSTSMEAPAGPGRRIDLAADATRSSLATLPDNWSVGLWSFAFRTNGDADWTERTPVRALDADTGDASQRDALNTAISALPGELTGGGTGLYDTALDAVRTAHGQYQEGSNSTVVLLTDGTDDDDAGGRSLQGLLDTLTAEADPARPVRLLAVALGPEADLGVLQQIAAATGGKAYSAQNPSDLQEVLYDAVRNQ